MSGNCKTCRHWSRPQWKTAGFGTCCLATARSDAKPPLEPVTKVCGVGGAYLATSETFGCVFHEAKE